MRRASLHPYIGGALLFNAARKTNLHDYGAGPEAALNLLIGVLPAPKPQGGEWLGVDVRALLAFYAGIATYPTPAGSSAGNSGTGIGVGSLGVGLEYIHFDSVDAQASTQHGIGVYVGARVGVQGTGFFSDNILQQGSQVNSTGGFDAQVGGELALVLPAYDTQRGHLSRMLVGFSASELPGTGLIFFTLGAGWAF